MAAKRFLLCILLDQCWSSFCGLDLLGKQKSRSKNGFFAFADSAPVTNGVVLIPQANVRFA